MSVLLGKVTLDKARPTINLKKRGEAFGEIRMNLNWHRPQPARGLAGLFGRRSSGVDLDLGCLYEMQDGSKGVVQALGNAFGSLHHPPYIELSADDRTGAAADGEWLRLNGKHWGAIRRVLVYAFIYEGVPNWAATDGVVTVHAPGEAPIEVRLDDAGRDCGMCAIASIENAGGEIRVTRQVRYFAGHNDMDQAYRWGLRWTRGTKD